MTESCVIGCGNFAASIVYGRFDIENDENTREAVSPFTEHIIVDSDLEVVALGVWLTNIALIPESLQGKSYTLRFEIVGAEIDAIVDLDNIGLSQMKPIPTVSEWGILALSLLLLIVGSIVLSQRRSVRT